MASGCSQEEVVQQIASLSKSKFIATFEQNDSRTYLEDGKYLRWSADDELSIFMGTTLNKKFRFDGETGDNSGGFEDVSTPGFVTGNNLDNPCHYAIYPYNKGTKITETGILTINLPSEQTYAENSFGLGNNTMVAVTSSLSDMNLAFKNVCGYLKLKLYGNDVTVKTITLQSNGGEKLSGSATLTASYGKNPSVTMSSTASDMITLDCGEAGVKIGATKEEATEFWFVLPATSFSQGFTLTIDDINGGRFVKTTSKNIIVERNVIKPISAFEVVMEDATPYVTFTANQLQMFMMSKVVSTLQYSVNNGDWNDFEEKTGYISFGGENGSLRLRGKNLTGTATGKDYDKSAIVYFYYDNVEVSCQGDIRTLIDYEAYETVSTKNARFCHLFSNCENLTSAPELPAIDFADYCYYGMFSSSALTSAPELPAIDLADYCYCDMFSRTALTNAPDLPATNLASHCYERMFYSCSNLTGVPELPATSLADYCYSYMFANCTKLTNAPNLAASNLADYCYQYMFDSCFKLTTVQASLPATTLVTGCYMGMFGQCSVLTAVPELPAMTLATRCYSSMFQNCKMLTTAPELPATTLTNECYSGMFNGCRMLSFAPELPAKVLTPSCYERMFYNCTSLTKVVMLATNINATNSLSNWLYNVGAWNCNITISADIDYKLFPEGSSGIPTGWVIYRSTK